MITWTAAERTPLEHWLLSFDPIDRDHGARVRELLCNAKSLDGSDLVQVSASLDVLVEAWSREYSSTQYLNAPTGRNARRGCHAPCLSDWELLWLRIHELAARGELAWGKVENVSLSGSMMVLPTVALVAVCGFPDDAARLARTTSEDAPVMQCWLRWIAGDATTVDELAESAFGSWLTNRDPLVAAIRGDWDGVISALPKKAREPGDKPIANADKLLAQLARFKQGKLDAKVLRTSFGKAFGWSYHPHSSYELADKVPFAYLYGTCFDPAAPPVRLVANIGAHVTHIKAPPSRTFVVPAEVRARLGDLQALANEACARSRSLRSQLTRTGVQIGIDLPPAMPDEMSFADL